MKKQSHIEEINEIREMIDSQKQVLKEGIDIDYQNRTVSYNPSHEKHVDTSSTNNPTIDDSYGENVGVWSIFKRKDDDLYDGNPLLYAMKGERSWKFRSDKDKKDIVNQIMSIAYKFAVNFKVGFTIIIPSGNELNKFIADIVAKYAKNAVFVNDVLTKITTEEILEIASEPNSPFMRFYKDEYETALRQLKVYLDKMDQERGGYFTRHFVTDAKMRNVLTQTLKLSDDAVARYAKLIDGKDILLIDDSISRGQTIREACKILTDNYAPKTISVLTLFSRLYKD